MHDEVAVVQAVLAPFSVPLKRIGGNGGAQGISLAQARLFELVLVADDDTIAFQRNAVAGAVANG